MKILVIIPARGGSKGIPHKNIKPLNGKPLIRYTIDVARGVAKDEDICVSTDDPEIIEKAMNQFDDVWIGKHCKTCKRREFCPDPIA